MHVYLFELGLVTHITITVFEHPGPSAISESEIIAKYEIMDGLPVRGCY